MPSDLISVLVVLVLPALLLATYQGWLKNVWQRVLAALAVFVAVASAFPKAGESPQYIEQLSLLLAGGVAVVLLLRHYQIPWAIERKTYLATVLSFACLSLLSYFNFFAFHGERSFVQYHDVAHYYLGSKYFGELGYTDLYTAMLRAEGELTNGRLTSSFARDLKTNEEVRAERLLWQSDAVKESFSTGRWAEFLLDVDYFRRHLSPDQWRTLLFDHGFNPTPAWTLIGNSLSRWVPAGSHRGIILLTLVDVFLLSALFGAVYWAFGVETLLLTLTYFFLAFGAGFDWVGGAFLRYGWLFGVVAGFCCLKKERFLPAGVLFAGAASLRIFPVFFLVPLIFKAGALTWRKRSIPKRYRVFFASSIATLVVLFLLTGLLPRGWNHWREFREHMSAHVETLSLNTIGLTEILSYEEDPSYMTKEQSRVRHVRRQRIYRLQLVVVLLPLLYLVGRWAPVRSDLEAAMLALPLIFSAISLAGYYYVLLLLVIVLMRSSPGFLAATFAIEATSYILLQFGAQEFDLYVYRSILIAFLYFAVFLPNRRAADETQVLTADSDPLAAKEPTRSRGRTQPRGKPRTSKNSKRRKRR